MQRAISNLKRHAPPRVNAQVRRDRSWPDNSVPRLARGAQSRAVATPNEALSDAPARDAVETEFFLPTGRRNQASTQAGGGPVGTLSFALWTASGGGG